MLLKEVYPIISLIVFWGVMVFVAVMTLRLIFSFTDPNPFGKLGRFAYSLRKATDSYVHPFANFLFLWRIDKKYAPILTAIIFAVVAYFGLGIIENTFFIMDGLINAKTAKTVIGYILYALLSIYILFIFLRLLSSWFVFGRRTFFGFVRRVTDPVMIPFQKLIPPIGMFDISAMILLILLQLLQTFVRRAFEF